ncbi:protein phosphatase 1 regulatory subunit 3B-like [Babylonia areolata]|uniref:protein phosphatase 1 regulatory subunit 3B-like n=1 Tax=Babylonia areolata TaxID=304850 RepID=UPI003FD1E074
MLDIVPSADSRPCSMMSMDLSPYLLSVSPPNSDFSLHSLSLASNYSPYSFFSPPPARSSTTCVQVSTTCVQVSTTCVKVYGPSCGLNTTPLKSIMSANSSRDKDSHSVDSGSSESNVSAAESTVGSPSVSYKSSKRVSFADDAGKPLTEVRMMLDNPSAPPTLTSQGLAELFHLDELSDSLENEPPLLTPVPQPLEKPTFEEDLRRNRVAVENIIVNEYDLTCTIYVDNRASSKWVFGRCTTDGWQSFRDVTALFNQTRRPGYDTYQFTLHISPPSDRSHPIQFAVCYEADGIQCWDNNAGNNYVVHWNQDADPHQPANYLGGEDPNANSVSSSNSLLRCPQDDLETAYY